MSEEKIPPRPGSDQTGRLPIVDEQAVACSETRGALTNEEVAVMAAMRELKLQVKELKQKQRAAERGDDQDLLEGLASRLATARRRWQQLEEQREAARHRRMVMLGHTRD